MMMMNEIKSNLLLKYPIKPMFKWAKQGVLLLSPNSITNIDNLYSDHPIETLDLLEQMRDNDEYHPTHKLQIIEVYEYFKNKYIFR